MKEKITRKQREARPRCKIRDFTEVGLCCSYGAVETAVSNRKFPYNVAAPNNPRYSIYVRGTTRSSSNDKLIAQISAEIWTNYMQPLPPVAAAVGAAALTAAAIGIEHRISCFAMVASLEEIKKRKLPFERDILSTIGQNF